MSWDLSAAVVIALLHAPQFGTKREEEKRMKKIENAPLSPAHIFSWERLPL